MSEMREAYQAIEPIARLSDTYLTGVMSALRPAIRRLTRQAPGGESWREAAARYYWVFGRYSVEFEGSVVDDILLKDVYVPGELRRYNRQTYRTSSLNIRFERPVPACVGHNLKDTVTVERSAAWAGFLSKTPWTAAGIGSESGGLDSPAALEQAYVSAEALRADYLGAYTTRVVAGRTALGMIRDITEEHSIAIPDLREGSEMLLERLSGIDAGLVAEYSSICGPETCPHDV